MESPKDPIKEKNWNFLGSLNKIKKARLNSFRELDEKKMLF